VTRSPAPLPLPLLRLEPPLIEALETLYEELARELRSIPARCDACGSCCHLARAGHELWLTAVELAYLFRAAGPRPLLEAGLCPYLEGERCAARSGRALGCRIYHCGLPTPVLEDLGERYQRRLLEVMRVHGLEPAYGELLASLASLGSEHARDG
jgi:Fe-S-cluster containining protein